MIRIIEEIYIPLSKWFKDDKMKINPDEYRSLLFGNDDRSVNIGNYMIKN